eukprot:c5355_g1_i1.p1 GENE.c5355_g1_i1~~c5355_g1_i1.p1  ORF type:complete len:362 (+),score=73.33 c5355_g1_i1:37-1122(+)
MLGGDSRPEETTPLHRPSSRSWASPARLISIISRKQKSSEMTESLPTSLQVPPLSFENLRTRTLKELMADDSLTPRQLVRTMRREKRMKALQYFDPADDGDDEFVDEEEDEHELSSRQVKELVAIFNEDAKKGLKRFWEAGLVGQSAIDVANFFLDNERLSRVQIGIFIGDDDPFSQQVLRCFVAQFSFDGLELDDALRIFFVSFVLPSESQIIERILEAFSEHYAFCNCDTPLKDADTAMALAFALIMLNTDLHNPEIKTKMTREQFVSNFDGVEERRRLPKAVLTHAYDRIKQKELKLTPETSDHLTLFLRSDHQGWLSKLGGRQKTQKRRWFILKSNVLFYFKDPQVCQIDVPSVCGV